MIPSDRYRQGIDIVYKDARLPKKTNGVYILTDDNTDEIVKIGSSRCLDKRIHILYKSVRNTTNDKIRNYIKDNDTILSVQVYTLPVKRSKVMDGIYNIEYSGTYSLERNIIDSYIDEYGKAPVLQRGRY